MTYRLLSWWRERSPVPGVWSDLYDGTVWQIQAQVLGDPNLCPGRDLQRNLVFSFCADGVSPFKFSAHSICPVALACCNLPGHMRMTLPALWICTILPAYGPSKGEPDDFNPFFDILADEAEYGYHFGVENVQDSTWRYIARHCEFYKKAIVYHLPRPL